MSSALRWKVRRLSPVNALKPQANSSCYSGCYSGGSSNDLAVASTSTELPHQGLSLASRHNSHQKHHQNQTTKRSILVGPASALSHRIRQSSASRCMLSASPRLRKPCVVSSAMASAYSAYHGAASAAAIAAVPVPQPSPASHFTTTALNRWSILNRQLPPVENIKALHVYDFDNTREFSSPSWGISTNLVPPAFKQLLLTLLP